MYKPTVIKKSPIAIKTLPNDVRVINAYVHGDYAYTDEIPQNARGHEWSVTHVPSGKSVAECVTRTQAEMITCMCAGVSARWNGQGEPERELLETLKEIRNIVIGR